MLLRNCSSNIDYAMAVAQDLVKTCCSSVFHFIFSSYRPARCSEEKPFPFSSASHRLRCRFTLRNSVNVPEERWSTTMKTLDIHCGDDVIMTPYYMNVYFATRAEIQQQTMKERKERKKQKIRYKKKKNIRKQQT